MKIKEFERMFCDSLSDIQQGKEDNELREKIHYVNTFERLGRNGVGVEIILNDGSKFNIIMEEIIKNN